MSAILLPNTRSEEGAPTPPTRDNGEPYRWEMVCQGDTMRAYADTYADLIAVLIPGYDDLPAEERLTARIRYVTDLISPLQARLLASAEWEQRQELSPQEREVLLRPRFEPLVIETWESQVPLVLVDTHYQPYTDVPAPIGVPDNVRDPFNIAWLRPADENTLLSSLARCGVINLSEHADWRI